MTLLKRRTAVLISGSGSNLQALIDAASDDKTFPAELTLVISNKKGAYGLERAKAAGIPTRVIAHKDYDGRDAFDSAVHEALEDAQIEFVCLAGFMRILTQPFVQKWNGRMLNIHPSLLPAFPGNRAHQQVIASSVALSGCTVHAVTEELDGGPIVAQGAVARRPDDDSNRLSERVKRVEHIVYPLAVRTFLTPPDAPKPDTPTVDGAVIGTNPWVRYKSPRPL